MNEYSQVIFGVRMSSQIKDQLLEEARKQSCSMSSIARRSIVSGLRQIQLNETLENRIP